MEKTKTMTLEKNILISAQELYLAVCKKIKGGHDSIDAFKGYFEALDLLYSEPKLGDFVPTNEKGEVMEKPIHHSNGEFDTIEVMEWDEALDRRLWDGWEIKRGELSYPNEIAVLPDIQITYSNHIGERFFKHKTYEKLITSGVKLERIQRE